jgi:hypothetical protein
MQVYVQLRVLTGRHFIELQRCCLHDSSSHENDGSKYLKYDHVDSVYDAAITAPQLSGGQLRRNMQLTPTWQTVRTNKLQRSVQRRVYNVRNKLTVTKKRLDYAEIDLTALWLSLCKSNDWRELVRKHNDPDDSYHLRFFYFVVIGSEVIAERDIVRINFSSPWMLANSLSVQLQQVGDFS